MNGSFVCVCGGGGVFSIRKEENKDEQQNERKERKNREVTALRSLKQLMLTLNRGNRSMVGLHIVSIVLSTQEKN